MADPEEVPAGVGYPGPFGQGLDLAGMLESAGDLVNPAAAARQLPWLAGELVKIALGQSDIWFDEKDKRFTDVAWRDNPFYHLLGQGYRLYEEWMSRMVEAADGPWQRQARNRYLANIITASLSPANFLWTNPLALKRAFETGGQSVVRGGVNMLRDLAGGGMPRMVDRQAFGVGEKLACTPGSVVYRDEIFELLQYAPATPAVRSVPLLMVPPELNRYYVLDLAPGRSMVEFAVEQGIQTFMIVWRNPRPELGHGRWGVDDYLAAQARAAEIVRKITHSDTVNWLGLCAGGITIALFLGYLAAKGDRSAGSATYMVTMLTNDYPNIVGMSDSSSSRTVMRSLAAAGQVIPGNMLRTSFAWLRPNDLVFNYLVSGWLLGEDPPAFDVLAWNDDATGLSVRFAAETTELLVDRKPARPGGMTVLGTPIDLAKVDCDSFHVAGYTDHICPWRACYTSTRLLGGDKEMVMVKSGHIQSFVNPAKTAKYGYWTGPPAGPDPDRWLETAAMHERSWWPRWAEWLVPRSGEEKNAPSVLGSHDYPPLGPAPGTYVHE
ncbi:MAG TPA: alpha/beta fold hydrolase [Streptosporangiaceae bacterium]|nr:alpha/beta fold hydrolase [Streptosporangiaceae bacterium]